MTNESFSSNNERITLGGGCFWCIEAVFQRLQGVDSAVSGYAGGPEVDPTYKEVCSGGTGHAEVVQVTFDPAVVSLAALLKVFFAAHDATTLNRQGGDAGPQYRSIILYDNAAQKTAAEQAVTEAQAESRSPIVTQIVPLEKFYAGEGYHQDYYNLNGGTNPYCSVVIRPKLVKLIKAGLIAEH